MLSGWLTIVISVAFVAALYALAKRGDALGERPEHPALRKAIYVLAVCAYCSSWTYYGAIGLASRRGLDFLPLFVGPALVAAVFNPVLVRMARVAKAQNITSIADFVAVRYGKSAPIAAIVTVLAAAALVPFLAIQIKAVAGTLSIFLDGTMKANPKAQTDTLAAVVALVAGAFTAKVGASRANAAEHHRGLIVAVAACSAIKLVTFVGLGVFVCWGLYDGFSDLTAHVAANDAALAAVDRRPTPSFWIAATIASTAAMLVLPRQFHVTIVENRCETDIRTAAWAVPIYFAATCAFVMPIVAAGVLIFPDGAVDRDFTILALPIHANAWPMTVMALIGALAASASTLAVSTMALAGMISNDLIMPMLLRLELRRPERALDRKAPPILGIRRAIIVAILGLAWLCSTAFDKTALSTVVLLSLAVTVQIAPAALGGLVWTRGTARGAITGCLAGAAASAYTLILPAVSSRSSPLLLDGPLAIDVLRPTNLFGLSLSPFAQGLAWSLLINIACYIALSLSRPANTNERLQADIFVLQKSPALADSLHLRSFGISIGELLGSVARYLGRQQAERLFEAHLASRNRAFAESNDADASLIKYAETLIAPLIGAASSRTVISLLLERREGSQSTALQTVDDAALEAQNSRDVLQHAIDIAHDGMAVFDRDLRLVAWNRAYRELFQLPPELMHIGVPLDVLVRSNAERGVYGPGAVDDAVARRIEALTQPSDGDRMYQVPFGRVLGMRSVRLHNGGLFFTYTDATAQARSEEDLEAENFTLERRVRERTEQLESLNFELARAKAEAEDANISKTRFLAAASHDLLQPLNAARLYTTSLRERVRDDAETEEIGRLATHVDASLEAVEDILGALLEISHLDAGATRTEITTFSIGNLLRQLEIEFEPMARERGLRLKVLPSTLRVKSDRRLLRRLLQNLISNAIKYTSEGRVLVGSRRSAGKVQLCVYDTGVGIPRSSHARIFREFERLPGSALVSHGAGLGLSIVERLSRVLDHEITLRSEVGRGSLFSVRLPRGADIAGPVDAITAPSRLSQPRQRSLNGLRVAAIDNEPDILVAMDTLLQGWDCVVVVGKNLKDIAAALEAATLVPDVIVADLHVDEMDGLAIIKALRKRYGPCPAVLVTADRAAEVRERAFAADVRVLNKPVKPAALRSLLSQWRLVRTAAE